VSQLERKITAQSEPKRRTKKEKERKTEDAAEK